MKPAEQLLYHHEGVRRFPLAGIAWTCERLPYPALGARTPIIAEDQRVEALA
jgi:hypothetical protein